jgi:hypothetical protein
MQNRVNCARFTRWDHTLKQGLPWFDVQILFTVSNIIGANEMDVNQKIGSVVAEQRYGMSGGLGFVSEFDPSSPSPGNRVALRAHLTNSNLRASAKSPACSL